MAGLGGTREGAVVVLLVVALLLSSQSQCAATGLHTMPLEYTLTGVAAAQQELHLDGQGTVIAVLDTGVNYKHPAFGDCQRPGKSGTCRVYGGFDFVGDTQPQDILTGLASAAPDADPMECSLNMTHGTQVASVAAGDARNYKQHPWRGVAYAAGILAYKVTGACLDAPGAVSTNATLSAIRKAADAGADVINLSWGDFRAGGYADASYAAALTYAERKGSLVAVAAGNNGLMGPFFVEGGVSADDVLNVASVDVIVNVSSSRLQFNMPLNVGKEHVTSVVAFGATLPPTSSLAEVDRWVSKLATLKLPLDIVRVTPEAACSPIATPRAALQGRVALVQRGGCSFQYKVTAAAAAGAVAVIVYDSADESQEPFHLMTFDEMPELPVWGVQLHEGQAIAAAAAKPAAGAATARPAAEALVPPAGPVAGRMLRNRLLQQKGASQPKTLQLVAATRFGSKSYSIYVRPSSFSSWGPCVTLDIIPAISAPGSELLAASSLKSFTTVQGTSFATPFVSGALALWRQAYSNGRLPPLYAAPPAATAAGAAATAASAVAFRPQLQPTMSAKGAGGRHAAPAASKALDSRLEHIPSTKAVAKAPAAAAAAAAPQLELQASRRLPGSPNRKGSSSSSQQQAATAKLPPTGATAANRGSTGSNRGAAKPAAPLQQAAYTAFMSTARPVDWHAAAGWAEPVARVGAGLIQVGAAIRNPTVISPPKLLLRSNKPAQTVSVIVTNTAPFRVSYTLGHTPAAALRIDNLWFVADQEELYHKLAAGASFVVAAAPAGKDEGKAQPVSVLDLGPGESRSLQVTFSLPKALLAHGYLYSGYITLTPRTSGTSLAPGAAAAAAVKPPPLFALIAVPLVIPYQGYSQNYTTLSILPASNAKQYPDETAELKGLLHVCYASYNKAGMLDSYKDTEQGSNSNSSISGPPEQDGALGPEAERCLSTAPVDSSVTNIPLNGVITGKGVIMVALALQRPAVRMSLMLFEADPCQQQRPPSSVAGPAAALGASQHKTAAERSSRTWQPPRQQPGTGGGCSTPGAVASYKGLVGEVWHYNTPSRDFPGSLWAYYSDAFKGNATRLDWGRNEVIGSTPVVKGKLYRMQLWVVAPLATADRDAGDRYKTWKFDIPGGFKFT